MKIIYSSFSECGPRDKNEDYVKCYGEVNTSVFVLCDGMGGHDNGEVASKLVAETIVDTFQKNVQSRSLSLQDLVISSCEKAKSEIDNCSEMGTTAAIVAIKDNIAAFAHSGDSRIYHIRNGRIIYQSVDHIAISSSGNPVITRAFFPRTVNYKPDIYIANIEKYDRILICSDGVFGEGKWSALHDVLRTENFSIHDIQEVASHIAHDNYSAILIEVIE